MRDILTKNRLRPSLLERLTDQHPERQRETAQELMLNELELRELIRRDLTWLFSTTHMAAGTDLDAYPHVKGSVLNFGLQALTGSALSSIPASQLQQHVLDTLRAYEPRLVRESVKVEVHVGSRSHGACALVIDIEAELWADPLPLALHLRTEIDVETGRVNVDEARPELGS